MANSRPCPVYSHAVYIVQLISANINDVNKINTVTVQVFQPWYWSHFQHCCSSPIKDVKWDIILLVCYCEWNLKKLCDFCALLKFWVCPKTFKSCPCSPAPTSYTYAHSCATWWVNSIKSFVVHTQQNSNDLYYMHQCSVSTTSVKISILE